ncbi:MAG: hypothetical protein LOY00_01970, partial [Methylocaldum sp.]|nr:hypothetical protein [Methylocaldum sp.]
MRPLNKIIALSTIALLAFASGARADRDHWGHGHHRGHHDHGYRHHGHYDHGHHHHGHDHHRPRVIHHYYEPAPRYYRPPRVVHRHIHHYQPPRVVYHDDYPSYYGRSSGLSGAI